MEKARLITNELFNLINEENLLTLDFHKKEIDFERDKCFFDNAFFNKVKDKSIRIRGKGPVELYAYASYWCTKYDCESIIVTDFNLSRDFEIYKRGNSYPQVLPPWCAISKESDSVILSVVPSNSPDGHWNEEVIVKNSSCFMFADSSKFAILTGQGSLLFYSIMACSAAVSGYENLFVKKPIEKNLIGIAGPVLNIKPQNKKAGTMIGILGDPNSGKSVFSKVLENILRKYSDGKTVWTYDCDAAAPTPNWYIYGLQNANSQEEADIKTNARKATKQKWTEQLERKVSEYMKTIKSNIDFIVADFPGGRHDEKKNIHERIPSEARAEMLKNCDYFVIIARSDVPDRITDWKKALNEYNLANRVIAEIISRNPQAAPVVETCSLAKGEVFHATVCGLDRNNLINDIVSAFYPSFKEFAEINLSR
ncbi:MAG: hypothetical protein J6Y16_09200 [Treponema sp.]|nr:hypothetical protein [Treponema sp.]